MAPSAPTGLRWQRRKIPFIRGWCYRGLGAIARFRRDWDQANAHLQNAVAIAEATNERWNRGLTYIMLADVAHETGDAGAESQHLATAAALLEPLGDKWGMARWCESSARQALHAGDFVRAADLLGAADALRSAGGSLHAEIEKSRNADLRALLADRLGETGYNVAITTGETMASDPRMLVESVRV